MMMKKLSKYFKENERALDSLKTNKTTDKREQARVRRAASNYD